jgi:hypothetical protein
MGPNTTGREALSPEVKRPENNADYSRASSAKAKNKWSYSSTGLFDFMV